MSNDVDKIQKIYLDDLTNKELMNLIINLKDWLRFKKVPNAKFASLHSHLKMVIGNQYSLDILEKSLIKETIKRFNESILGEICNIDFKIDSFTITRKIGSVDGDKINYDELESCPSIKTNISDVDMEIIELEGKINEALDNKDKKRFMKLTNQLKTLEKMSVSQKLSMLPF